MWSVNIILLVKIRFFCVLYYLDVSFFLRLTSYNLKNIKIINKKNLAKQRLLLYLSLKFFIV